MSWPFNSATKQALASRSGFSDYKIIVIVSFMLIEIKSSWQLFVSYHNQKLIIEYSASIIEAVHIKQTFIQRGNFVA